MDKHEVYKELALNRPAKEIAEDLGCSYSAVLKAKREFEDAKLQGKLSQLMDVDRTVLEHAADDLGIDKAAVQDLAKGLDGLQNLDTALQQTALQINQKVKTMLMSVEQPSELYTYTEIITMLQKAFLGKDTVAIQINQNNGSQSSAYKQFLGDAPGA